MYEWFTLVVAVLAAIYACVARYLQIRLINKDEMQAVQAESKRLSDDYDKAKKSNDRKRMDELMKEQLELLPKMNKIMFSQFKPMLIILAIFFVLTWAIAQIDPFAHSQIVIPLHDDGKGCDAVAGDHIYSACFTFNATSSANYGKWDILFETMKNGAVQDSNSTYVLYGVNSTNDSFVEGPKGQPLIVWTDKTGNLSSYLPGDTVRLYAQSGRTDIDGVDAVLDNGSSFYADLPLAIPIINVQRIHEPYWWFIFISFTLNLALTIIMGMMQKPAAAAAGEVKK